MSFTMSFLLFLLFCALIIIGLLLATGLRIAGLPDLWPSEQGKQPGKLSRPRPSTKRLIAGALCLTVGLGGLAYIRHAATNDIINRADASCPQYASPDNYCVGELEKALGVNTEEVIQEAERNVSNLTGEQTRDFTALACTTPTKELYLTAAQKFTLTVTPADLWRNYALRATTKNNTRYIVLPEGLSPEDFQDAADSYYAGMYEYAVQWASPDGGWITRKSQDGWDDLLNKQARPEAPALTRTEGTTQIISCSE